MGAILVPVVIVIIALVAGAIALRWFSRQERERGDRLHERDRATLRYVVPQGQDPAAVLASLDRAGYEVVSDATLGQPGELLIGGARGQEPDREKVRRVLEESTQLNLEGDVADEVPPVRFQDE